MISQTEHSGMYQVLMTDSQNKWFSPTCITFEHIIANLQHFPISFGQIVGQRWLVEGSNKGSLVT